MVAAAPLPTDDELARLNLFRSVDVATVRSQLRSCSVRCLQAHEILIHADQPNEHLGEAARFGVDERDDHGASRTFVASRRSNRS